MSWREKAAAWLGKFMHVPDYPTFEEAMQAQGIHDSPENPVGVSDSISLKLTKGDPDAVHGTGVPGNPIEQGVPAEPQPRSNVEFRDADFWRPNLDPSDIHANDPPPDFNS